MEVHRVAPAVSHLLFTDDSFFFFRANAQEGYVVKDLLHQYELALGKSVNFQKLRVFYSSNVKVDCQQHISVILQVFSPLNHGKYLGLPSLIGRNKHSIFSYLRDRLWKRIHG
ncbi:hypothetical protein POPTR_002G000452v4 [Populus trichocarpa]|uniref:Uncharacterized protein n=1 Tax=Populus trichocarpa TaxID=3694 RepID=A0ACC0TB63_POPTR|nr:hypothetical protein POPTR_002G000452v4 [Populus trichocarpa]